MFPESLSSLELSGPIQYLLAAGVAVAAAAPLGPISILTIQRAMSMGFGRAFWPTIGAVAADGLFGFIAALGSGYLTEAIMGGRFWLRLAGSVILVAMGIRLSRHHMMARALPEDSFGIWQLGLLNFTLVLSNPLTLGFYLAAFAFMGLESKHMLSSQSLLLGAGIVTGSVAWFSCISLAAARLQLRLSEGFLGRVRAAVGFGFILLGFLSAAWLVVTHGS